MKTDLATTLLAAVAGFVVAFLVVNFLMPELQSVSFKELSGNNTYSLAEPDVNTFNYRALNPTVEVYVGDKDDNTTNQDQPEQTDDNTEE